MARRPRYHLADLLLIIALCGLVLGLVQSFRSIGQPHHSFAHFLLIEARFMAWVFTWQMVRAKRRATECQECECRFVPPMKITGPAICPQCHQRSLDPKQFRKEQAERLWSGLYALVAFSIVLGLLLSLLFAEPLKRNYWIAFSLVSLGSGLGLIAFLFLIFVVLFLARSRLSRSERYVLAHARKVTGEEGQEAKSGPITFWSSGPPDPVPMLRAQMEISRRRFEALSGGVPEALPPLRIFCFSKRGAFMAFHRLTLPILWNLDGLYAPGPARTITLSTAFVAFLRQTITNLWNLDGLYAPGPARTITLSTEVVPYRLADPERTARSLFGFYFLETSKGFLPRPWLQQGIANAVAYGGDGGELARLNRKMLAALSRGDSLDAALFRLKPGAMLKLVRGWYDHRNFRRFAQFNAQSWSVVEFLGGQAAPEERRGRFRAFVHDLRAKVPDEEVFERHFGHGFGPLLDGWKEWVLGQGIGTHSPPPTHIQEALTERLIPLVWDPQAKIMDRIQAIRDMGRVGYVLGADTLIDLLQDGDRTLKDELVWALEAISGLAWGDDPDRWRTWWDELAVER